MECSSLLLFRIVWSRLGGLVKGRKRLVPHAVQVGPQGGHPGRIELVYPARAFGPADYEPAVPEHAKVLGDRRPAHRQLLRQFAHRAWAPGQQLEDRAPGRVTEKTQPAISVSLHER